MMPASAESKCHQRIRCYAAEVRADTSPPNGMLAVNRRLDSARSRQHTLNQHFDHSHIRHRASAFTHVNAESTPQRAARKRTDRQGLSAIGRLTAKIAGCKLNLRRVPP